MASTEFQQRASFESSSSQKTCSAAASPSAYRTCPRSTSCPHCWVTSWRVCRLCFQCPSRMFSSLTSNRIWTQRPAASWTSASQLHCQADCFFPRRPWKNSCTWTGPSWRHWPRWRSVRIFMEPDSSPVCALTDIIISKYSADMCKYVSSGVWRYVLSRNSQNFI